MYIEKLPGCTLWTFLTLELYSRPALHRIYYFYYCKLLRLERVQKKYHGRSYCFAEQLIPQKTFPSHFMVCDAGIFTALFVHLRVKEYMSRLAKSSGVKWLLV